MVLLFVPLASTQRSRAGFSTQVARTHVEIEGVDFGTFDTVVGLDEDDSKISYGNREYKKVSLKRDFVTDPSLYLWAKNVMRDRSGLKEVHLIMENREGEELERYVLKLCQPLSWSVEASNPASGGFHESVDLAVQDIDVY